MQKNLYSSKVRVGLLVAKHEPKMQSFLKFYKDKIWSKSKEVKASSFTENIGEFEFDQYK